MRDLETKSEWCHLLGKAMKGELKDVKLKQLPSVMTTWESFRQRYPNGTVAIMSRTHRDFVKGLHGKSKENIVLALVHGNEAFAWNLDYLQHNPLQELFLGDIPVVVVYDAESATARMFERKLGKRLLNYYWEEKM